jgi:PIN like domain
LGAADIEWLSKVAHSGWVVLNRDAKIMERLEELDAYRAAKVHMFYLPGEATRDHLRQLVERNLHNIVMYATERNPEVWRINDRGVERFALPRKRRRT